MRTLLLACGLAILSSLNLQRAQAAITINFDTTYDTTGFFTTNAEAMGVLNAAANELLTRLGDSLTEIPSPTGPNTWEARFTHPGTGALQTIMNLLVPTDTIIIYVGGRDLSGSTLGLASTQFSASGTQTWQDTVVKRGQAGATTSPATSTDFGPWGGSISFDNTDYTWYFDDDPSTVDVPSGQVDFYSVALHEIGHLLGIGLAASWDHWINGSNEFTGPASMAEFGMNIALDAGAGHWADGTMSTLPGTMTVQEAAMDPSLSGNSRKFFTHLDWAALQDIGWEVTAVPEPAHVALAAGVGLVGFALARRARARTQVRASARSVLS